MEESGDQRPEGPDQPEILDTGPRSRVGLVVIAVACCLLLIGVVGWRVTTGRSAPSDLPSGRDSSAAVGPTPGARKVSTARLGWLGATTDYDVFLRTDQDVYRYHPRTDTVVRTPVPELASGGPLSFIPLTGSVLIAPMDLVPGYLVSDVGAVRRYGNGGQTLPGPGAGQIWSEQSHEGAVSMRLAQLGHSRARQPGDSNGTVLKLPRGRSDRSVAADGQGYLVVTNEDGSYDGAHVLRPGHQQRLIGGRLVAAGPSRLLVTRKGCKSACTVRVLGPDYVPVDNQPRQGLTVDPDEAKGVVAADRMTAAVSPNPDEPIVLFDLHTGEQIHTDIKVAVDQGLALSPDGRWLFAVGHDLRVHVVDTGTGRSRTLPGGISDIRQLAVRPRGS